MTKLLTTAAQPRHPLGAVFSCAIALALPSLASAQDRPPNTTWGAVQEAWRSATDSDAWAGDGHWRLGVSPFTHHFRYSNEHTHVWAVGLERQRPDNWLAGASYFRNSFGQPSAYLYLGKRFPGLFGVEQLFGQASAGLLYGYRGKYKNKVPLNVNGFSPGALVGMGWQFNRDTSVKLHMLGDAGVMFQLSYNLR
jgi:hypothetical protein